MQKKEIATLALAILLGFVIGLIVDQVLVSWAKDKQRKSEYDYQILNQCFENKTKVREFFSNKFSNHAKVKILNACLNQWDDKQVEKFLLEDE